MNRRASWRGKLTFADFNCEVGLYSALTSAEKISFNIVNRKTGHRVERSADLVSVLNAAFEAGGVHLVDLPVDYSENKKVLIDELGAKVCEL